MNTTRTKTKTPARANGIRACHKVSTGPTGVEHANSPDPFGHNIMKYFQASRNNSLLKFLQLPLSNAARQKTKNNNTHIQSGYQQQVTCWKS